MNSILLGPAWQVRPVNEFNQGFYPLTDDAWLEQDLPAHWQEHPQLRTHTGKVAYRYRFARPHAPEGAARRWWVRADGIFYWSQVFFNGREFPRHEGYFVPQEHEITGMLDAENTLVIEVDCPEERLKFGKRMITGVFSHWDCIDPATNPGGIWQPVTLESSGLVRLQYAGLQTAALDGTSAELRWTAEVDAAATVEVELRWTLEPATFAGAPTTVSERRVVSGGFQVLEGQFTLPEARLWWSHDLGRPDLYQATLEVCVYGELSDRRSLRLGVRTFEFRDFVPYLNGERFLIKGNNYGPSDTRIARVTSEQTRHDIQLAKNCNMNLLRVHAHIDHPSLYDAADELGVLLWQDFPLQWLYRRSILPEARRQVRQMVTLLGHHPSIVVWCMHNEPIFMTDTSDNRVSTALRIYFSVFGWSWNRDVMDQVLARDVGRHDPTRPVISNSGEYAVPGWHTGNDAHFYYGWYRTYGRLRGFDWVRRQFPQNLRFVSEFGAQSFPNYESSTRFMSADIKKIDWHYLARHNSFQPHVMAYWYNWRSSRSLEELITRTQRYQIEVNRFYIDRLRLSKYRPTGGIVPFLFADSNPAIQWSILDYWRVPKASYWAMRDAFSPQYAWTILDADEYPPHQEIAMPIYIVNDTRTSVDYTVTVRVIDAEHTTLIDTTTSGTLDKDCLPEVATLVLWTPPDPGDYRLEIELHSGDEPNVNCYDLTIRG